MGVCMTQTKATKTRDGLCEMERGRCGEKRRGCTPLGSRVQQGVCLKVIVYVCVCVCTLPQPPHTHTPSGGGRSLSDLGALGVSGFFSSQIVPPPHPPGLAPSRKWVVVSAGRLCLLPGPPEPEQGPGEMAVVPATERTKESVPKPHVSAR